ncbi:MAG: hypothetical protein RL748_3516 [Pseudomonadota bacterium]|jgi:4-hydroxybenzoate polyprenyltransferase
MNSSVALGGSGKIGILLRLGRVSNLPTVWSNVLAGVLLAKPDASLFTLLQLCWAVSAFYIGGMYLNDAFDREIDARERPTRPIPSGAISAASVFGIGFGLLGAGMLLLLPFGARAMLYGAALVATILLYNTWHKGNPASPLIMGLCRALVYLSAAIAVNATGPQTVWLAALALFAHVIGLTYAAKQESLDRITRLWPLAILALPLLLLGPGVWQQASVLGLLMLLAVALADAVALRLLVKRSRPGAVPRAVAQLIAAIALVDGLALAANGAPWWALLACVLAWALTRVFQRVIPGT